MKFIYQGEKPCVILFGDACDMGAYCTDLNYFDIKPELIITDAEKTTHGAAFPCVRLRQ